MDAWRNSLGVGIDWEIHQIHPQLCNYVERLSNDISSESLTEITKIRSREVGSTLNIEE